MLHMVFRKIQGYLEPRFIWSHYVSRIFRHIHKVTHNRAYFFTLGLRPGQSNIKHYPLFKSGSSFKSLFKSIWNIFFIFVKVSNLHFLLQGSISVATITTIITCNQCQESTHPTNTTHASRPPTPPTLARYTQARNLSNSCYMPPTQAHHLCNSCKISTHVIHPGTPLMEPHRTHHQRGHEYKSFLKFIVDTFIKNKEEYEKITEMGRNNEYIIGNLLDYE